MRTLVAARKIDFFLFHLLVCQIATHISSQPVRWFYFPFSVLLNFHRELRWVNSKAQASLVHTAIDSFPWHRFTVPALPHRSHTVHRRCYLIFIMFFTVLVRQWKVIYRSLYLAKYHKTRVAVFHLVQQTFCRSRLTRAHTR